MSFHKIPLVLDKSFIRGSNATRLNTLTKEYDFYVPSAFYFELFNNKPKDRSATISGFEEFYRIDISSSLKKETESIRPLSIERSKVKTFNHIVRDQDWMVGSNELNSLKKYQKYIVEPMVDLFFRLMNEKEALGFTSDELASISGSKEDFIALCSQLIEKDRIRLIASMASIKYASLINPSWLKFRQIQAWALQVLILKRLYPDQKQALGRERMKHEILDLEYLILGLHLGALATKETSQKKPLLSMAWKFKFLSNKGLLIT